MHQRRIILTNLNRSVFTQRYMTSFLTELVINSLLYDEVLIRDADFICNSYITNHLRESENFEVFKELLKVGAVKILCLNPRSLSSDLMFDPKHQPLSARAEDHKRRRSYKGRPWRPESWEWELYIRLDDALRDSPAYQYQRPFPKHNDFAAELKTILQKRHENQLQKCHPFQNIDDAMAEKFIRFCSDPEEWVRFVTNNGVKKENLLLGPDGDFYRTAAYQCLAFFDRRSSNSMQRLLESTYAVCDCDREEADGRYGRSALAELPFAYDSGDEQRAAAEMIVKMETIPVRTPMTIGISPGIGEVLAAAREHQAFRDMQDAIRSLVTTDNPEKTFNYAWESLCSVVADYWARKMVHRKQVDIKARRVFIGLYLALRTLGFVVFHSQANIETLLRDLEWQVPLDYAIINRIEHWAPMLSRSVRAMTKLPMIQRQLGSAATLRCHRVDKQHR